MLASVGKTEIADLTCGSATLSVHRSQVHWSVKSPVSRYRYRYRYRYPFIHTVVDPTARTNICIQLYRYTLELVLVFDTSHLQ